MIDDIEELKALIVAKMDVMDFFDVLGIELADIVEFPEVEELIEENYTQLVRACR